MTRWMKASYIFICFPNNFNRPVKKYQKYFDQINKDHQIIPILEEKTLLINLIQNIIPYST